MARKAPPFFGLFKRWFKTKTLPELDKKYRLKMGLSEAEQLPDDLIGLISGLSYGDKKSFTRSQERIEIFFWDRLDRIENDFKSLLTYKELNIHSVALDGMKLVGGRAARSDTSTDKRQKVFKSLSELSHHPDFLAREAALEGLKPMIGCPSLAPDILQVVSDRMCDHNVYVRETARDLLRSQGKDAVPWYLKTIRKGNADGRLIAMRALVDEVKEDTSLVTSEALQTVAQLINADDSKTAYLAAVYLLDLLDTAPAWVSPDFRTTLVPLLEGAVPRFLQELDDQQGWWRKKVAHNIARFTGLAPGILPLLIEAMETDRAFIKDGVMRTMAAVGKDASTALGLLKIILKEAKEKSSLLFRAAAAFEAISGQEVSDDLVPVVSHFHQTIFFKMYNEDDIPTAVRFGDQQPLEGCLHISGDWFFLGLPHDHGITSSDKLLDDYMELRLKGLDREAVHQMLDREVEVTGVYRNHVVQVEKIAPRKRSY